MNAAAGAECAPDRIHARSRSSSSGHRHFGVVFSSAAGFESAVRLEREAARWKLRLRNRRGLNLEVLRAVASPAECSAGPTFEQPGASLIKFESTPAFGRVSP